VFWWGVSVEDQIGLNKVKEWKVVLDVYYSCCHFISGAVVYHFIHHKTKQKKLLLPIVFLLRLP
jgi:hypothetical protein